MHVSPNARRVACAVSLCLVACHAAPRPSASPAISASVSTRGADSDEASGELRWQGNAAVLDVRNVDGAIHARARGSRGDGIEVVAQIRRASEPLVLRAFPRDGGGTVICIAPAARPAATRCPEDGEWADRQAPLVDLEVRLPAETTLFAATVNGSVRAHGLVADVDARSVSGSVHLDTRGRIRAKTVNGSIDANIGASSWKEPMELDTVNGSISVELPRDAGAELRAVTVNGGVATQRPLTNARVSTERLEGTLGTGGGELRLETVNGRIRVR